MRNMESYDTCTVVISTKNRDLGEYVIFLKDYKVYVSKDLPLNNPGEWLKEAPGLWKTMNEQGLDSYYVGDYSGHVEDFIIGIPLEDKNTTRESYDYYVHKLEEIRKKYPETWEQETEYQQVRRKYDMYIDKQDVKRNGRDGWKGRPGLYVYDLIDPFTHVTRYVGLSTDPILRVGRHIKEASSIYTHRYAGEPFDKTSWLAHIKGKPELRVIRKFADCTRDFARTNGEFRRICKFIQDSYMYNEELLLFNKVCEIQPLHEVIKSIEGTLLSDEIWENYRDMLVASVGRSLITIV